jgi:hypothetical protein
VRLTVLCVPLPKVHPTHDSESHARPEEGEGGDGEAAEEGPLHEGPVSSGVSRLYRGQEGEDVHHL